MATTDPRQARIHEIAAAVRQGWPQGDTATEGGDVRERALAVLVADFNRRMHDKFTEKAPDLVREDRRYFTVNDFATEVDVLAAAGLLATAGTDEAVRAEVRRRMYAVAASWRVSPPTPADARRSRAREELEETWRQVAEDVEAWADAPDHLVPADPAPPVATAGTEGEAEDGYVPPGLEGLADLPVRAGGYGYSAGAVQAAYDAGFAAASPQGEAPGEGESLPGPDYVEDGVEVWEAGRFTVRRDATSTISDPSVTLSGNLRPDVADPRALGLALLAAAPRAAAPVGNVDRAKLVEAFMAADDGAVHEGIKRDEAERMAGVALAALRDADG